MRMSSVLPPSYVRTATRISPEPFGMDVNTFPRCSLPCNWPGSMSSRREWGRTPSSPVRQSAPSMGLCQSSDPPHLTLARWRCPIRPMDDLWTAAKTVGVLAAMVLIFIGGPIWGASAMPGMP